MSARPDQVGAVKDGRGRAEDVETVEQETPARVPPGDDGRHGIGTRADQAVVEDEIVCQRVGTHDRNLGIGLRKSNHFLETVWVDPVIGLDHLAVAAGRRDLAEGEVVVGDLGEQAVGVDDPDARILRSERLGDLRDGPCSRC